MTDKYTKEGLPIVTLDQVRSFGRDIQEDMKSMLEGKCDSVKAWLHEIDQENNGISAYIIKVAEQYPLEFRPSVFAHLASLYRLLKRQAEAYKMESE